MASLLEFQHVFEKAVNSKNQSINDGVDSSSSTSKNTNTKNNKDSDKPDKLDYGLVKNIKTLQSKLQLQEVEKSNKAIKANKTYKKKGDPNSTFADIQDDDSVMGNKKKLLHKKWTLLDRCLQWQLIQTFVESQPTLGYNLEDIHQLLKRNAIAPADVTYDSKAACITELNLKPKLNKT